MSRPPLPGPIVHDDGTVTFRVWAPRARQVAVVLEGSEHTLDAGERGWHGARLPAAAGDRYAYRLDGGDPRPDPASLRQPDGVHGASQVVDPRAFAWSTSEVGWQPPPLAGAALYELHVGTFTPEGTFVAAAARLPAIADLGVTHVEVMPINAFPGARNWGYDGVGWYAAHEAYGGPEGFAAFVDAAHRAGLAVILDVVHNHLGPSGNYLPEFGPYLVQGRSSAWGDALNLDGPGSDEVRAFIIGNACSWLERFGVDGLRLDAVHALVDGSATHLLAELADAVAALGATTRRPRVLIAESDRNDPQTVRPRIVGGLGLDAQWVDDLHHAVHVAVTGEHDGYYADYVGLPDVARAYMRGLVFDGGRFSAHRDRHVGAPLPPDVSGHRLISCIQNHDQVGNRPDGARLSTLVEPDLVRVAALLLCAAPHTPLLFAGDEHGETRPFPFFTSHPEPELAEAVRRGRREEFAAFASWQGDVPDPQAEATFASAVLDPDAAAGGGDLRRALWRDLLAARRAHAALGNGRWDLVEVHAASATLLLAERGDTAAPSVLVAANLSGQPARVEKAGSGWTVLVATSAAVYGGDGADVEAARDLLVLPPRSAALLTRT